MSGNEPNMLDTCDWDDLNDDGNCEVDGTVADDQEAQERQRKGDSMTPEQEKEAPNYSRSGALVKEQLMYNGVQLKYSEPSEARKSLRKWRLYVFKGKEHIDTIEIHKQSAYLIGKERYRLPTNQIRRVCDLPMDHQSISSQHAVLQYRQIITTNDYGDTSKKIKLYLIDLESSNGTFVNKERVPPSRYYEIKLGDVLQFGGSTREYVVMDEDVV
ncbi:hypothetical protein HDV03_001900 [Kappamyces sp. JEL0829]|nr:hypothetical protein HDV03_001900 [Kappamyces sp. JEL0829]